jgi:hypothetical protein
MSRNKLSKQDREQRMQARWKIIQIVNNHRMRVHERNPYAPKMLGMKNIQRAVCSGRRAMILPGKLLIEAGYQPHVSKQEKPKVLRKLIGKE